ncbi:MAG TPA: hypothetical protein VI386_07945 [Candidatus Sulfotelmatobacter sp.]
MAGYFLLLGLGLSLVTPAVGQESHTSRESNSWSQETTGTLSAAKNLRIKVDVGSVIVRGGEQQGITYAVHNQTDRPSGNDARRRSDAYKVSAYVQGDTAWITGELQGGHNRHFSGEFTVNVPRGMTLVRIETDGGNIETTQIAGRVEARSGGGNVHLDEIGGGAKGETGGGSIDVGTLTGDMDLRTGGGNIHVHQANGNILAETGGGNIEIFATTQSAFIRTGGGTIQVRQCNGKIKASTGGGEIDLGDVGGPAEIDTGGGNIRLTSAKGPVHAQTGGGGIELYGVPSARVRTGAGGITVKLIKTSSGDHGDSVLETSAGDITVYIASNVAVTVRANVDLGNGHHITSELPDIHISSEGDQWGPKSLTAEGNLNGGGPVLKVRTTTGDICFRRGK